MAQPRSSWASARSPAPCWITPRRCRVRERSPIERASHNTVSSEFGDFRVPAADFAEHLIGMLAELWGRQANVLRTAGDADWRGDDVALLPCGTVHRRGHAEEFHLRVGEHLVDPVDRAAGYAGGFEQLDPM